MDCGNGAVRAGGRNAKAGACFQSVVRTWPKVAANGPAAPLPLIFPMLDLKEAGTDMACVAGQTPAFFRSLGFRPDAVAYDRTLGPPQSRNRVKVLSLKGDPTVNLHLEFPARSRGAIVDVRPLRGRS